MFRALKTPREEGTSLRETVAEALRMKKSLSAGDVEKAWVFSK
jgi:hypothetical protein